MREGVSIGDVSTLGKFVVSGPDAEEFLDYLYPTTGHHPEARADRAMYCCSTSVVMCSTTASSAAIDETRFTLSLTSAGSTFGELWIRDWAESRGVDVRIMNQTMSLAAVNVTGPGALLSCSTRAGLS